MPPRVLYVTDDRDTYSRGNYYASYQRAFTRQAEVRLAHPLDEALPDPAGFDLVVLGHAAIENYARIRGARFIPDQARNQLWFRHAGLRALRRSRTPTVLFTKNDYKHFELKNAFVTFVRPRLVITHTRSALNLLQPPAGGMLRWLPFGVDTKLFTPPVTPGARPYAVGFRANANTEWNDGERERLFRALTRLEHVRPVSLTMSRKGEGFLVGEAYVSWMQSCSLLGNTVSAAGTVGPRFLEAMACDTMVIAPRNPYEGLLVPDVHYLALDPGPAEDFPALEDTVTRYLDDAACRQQLLANARALVAEHDVDNHVRHVFREIGV